MPFVPTLETPVLRAHNVKTLGDRVRVLRELVNMPVGGIRDAMMRQIGLAVTEGCPARDDICELRAIYKFVKDNVRYTGDITGKDTFQTALRTLQYRGGDCFPMAQKVICRNKGTGQYEMVRLGELRVTWPAYEALSYNLRRCQYEFQPIVNFQEKGVRPVMRARLSTGMDLVGTPDHRFWALEGQKAKHYVHNLVPRSLAEFAEMRKRYPGNAHTHTRILQAAQIPALDLADVSPAEAYLAGIYAAEGYSESRSKTAIAQFKPAVRERIESALAAVGATHRYQAPRQGTTSGAYYALHAGGTVDALREQGSNSFNMRLPGRLLSGPREIVREVLRAYGDGDGYHPKPDSAWANKVNVIHATSSEELVDDLRLGMLIDGRPTYVQRQDNHGGAGNKPIWRVHDWKSPGMEKRARVLDDALPGMRYGFVRSVEDAGEEVVGCITVQDNHNFFLNDGTLAFNCDDHSVLTAVLALENGFTPKWRITSNPGSDTWDHIYTMVAVPRGRNKRWVALDTTLPGNKFDVEPPRSKFRDFEVMP